MAKKSPAARSPSSSAQPGQLLPLPGAPTSTVLGFGKASVPPEGLPWVRDRILPLAPCCQPTRHHVSKRWDLATPGQGGGWLHNSTTACCWAKHPVPEGPETSGGGRGGVAPLCTILCLLPRHLLLVAVRGRMLGSWLPAEPTDPLILQLTGSWA